LNGTIILKTKFSKKKMKFKKINEIKQKMTHPKIDNTITIKIHSVALVIKSIRKGERLEMISKTKIKIKTWI
jgi:hypothetical protein